MVMSSELPDPSLLAIDGKPLHESIVDDPFAPVPGGRPTEETLVSLTALRESAAFSERLAQAHPNNHRRFAEAVTLDRDHWRQVLAGDHPLPRELELHPSRSCALDCWYCCSPSNYKGGRSRDEYARAVGRLITDAESTWTTLQVSGGREPLGFASLREIVDPAAAKMHTRLNTSGVATCQENRLPHLVHCFDYIAVSLDAASEASYASMKGRRAASWFQVVVDDLSEACQVVGRRARIELVVLVVPENVWDLATLVRMGGALGVDAVRLRRLKVLDALERGTQLAKRDIPPELLASAVAEAVQRGVEDGVQVIVNAEDFRADISALAADNRSPCYTAMRRLVVDAVGHCYPCPLRAYPRSTSGVGESALLGVNVFSYTSLRALWDACIQGRLALLEQACSSCYIADRYLNRFVAKLAADAAAGIGLEYQPFRRPPVTDK